MTLFTGSKKRPAFPDRTCEACGRRGGGDPELGLDNVVVSFGHELCGHCSRDFHASLDFGALIEAWVAQRRARGAA